MSNCRSARVSRKSGDQRKFVTIASTNHGFTLIELMIVVVLIGLLAALAVPNFIRSRTTSQMTVCISNLRSIDDAIQQWALETKQAVNSPVQFSDISAYLKRSVVCPAGGIGFSDSYTISTVGADPVCQRVPLNHVLVATEVAAASGSSSSSGNNGHGVNNPGNSHAHPPGDNNGQGKGP